MVGEEEQYQGKTRGKVAGAENKRETHQEKEKLQETTAETEGREWLDLQNRKREE